MPSPRRKPPPFPAWNAPTLGPLSKTWFTSNSSPQTFRDFERSVATKNKGKRSNPAAPSAASTAKKPKLAVKNDIRGLAAAERKQYLTDAGDLDAGKTNAALMALGFADGVRYSTANKEAHTTEGTFKTEANLDDVFFLQLCPVGTPKAGQKDENGWFHRRSPISLDNATISTNMLKMKINVWTSLTAMGTPMKMRILDTTVPKLVTVVACWPEFK